MMKKLIVALCLLITSCVIAGPVILTWTDNSNNETNFKIERAVGTGAFAQIATVNTDVVTYTDSTVTDGTTYNYRVRASNEAGDSAYSNTASVRANSAPTITNIADRTININTNTGAIAFTVGDSSEALTALTLTGTSSNVALVPNANIVFGGSGASRTVTVTPLTNQIGSTTITVTVSDGTKTANDTFVLTVNEVPPAAPSNLGATP